MARRSFRVPPCLHRMRPLLLLAAVLAAVGCDSVLTDGPSLNATLSTDGRAYPPNAEATLTVENTGTVPIEFRPLDCAARLEAEGAEGRWANVARDERPTCADRTVVLPPGEVADAPIPLSVNAGTYRFLLDESDGDVALPLSTEPFVVG